MEVKKRAKIITDWINNYCESTSFAPKALVVGISGGIDSSVVSTLCANTRRKTIVLTMPIKQIKSQHELSLQHANWLKDKYKNAEHHLLEMDKIFNSFSEVLNMTFKRIQFTPDLMPSDITGTELIDLDQEKIAGGVVKQRT